MSKGAKAKLTKLTNKEIKASKEIGKLLKDNKKNQNVKLLKELSNSTSSLNAALEAISSQNKQLVKEITDQNENVYPMIATGKAHNEMILS